MSALASLDFNLRGVVRVRLLDPTEEDAAKLERQLGPISEPSTGEPDITVRFVDELPTGPLTYVGLGESAFDDSSFYLLKSRGNVPAKTRIDFEQIGRRCQIECERAAPAIPHLLALVNLTALSKDVLPLHATAFLHRDRGVLATGWSKGGKTELLLGFMDDGATYVADEWVYLSQDRQLFGVPEPIRVWGWQVRQMPHLRDRLSKRERAQLRLTESLGLGAQLGLRLAAPFHPARSVLRRAAPLISRQSNLQVPPGRLFGGKVQERAHLDHLIFVASRPEQGISISAANPGEIATRMLASLEEERSDFIRIYRHYLFARPGHASELIEQAGERERRLLYAAVAGIPAHDVRHPYPVSIADLFRTVRDAIQVASPAGGARPLHQPDEQRP